MRKMTHLASSKSMRMKSWKYYWETVWKGEERIWRAGALRWEQLLLNELPPDCPPNNWLSSDWLLNHRYVTCLSIA